MDPKVSLPCSQEPATAHSLFDQLNPINTVTDCFFNIHFARMIIFLDVSIVANFEMTFRKLGGLRLQVKCPFPWLESIGLVSISGQQK
jgi:hypothetical protein